MAGELILVVDESAAIQDMCRSVLEMKGYRVAAAANGIAALAYPELSQVALLVIDRSLKELSGAELTRALRTDAEFFDKPVLLLVPDDETSDSESVDLLGANGFIRKPFEPEVLARKVATLLEEKRVLEEGRLHLKAAAERMMQQLAEATLQEAVEQRTQIITERALQMVVSQVDYRARREVEQRVSQLTAEKEQELVKMTVQEVARSMIEKLAERRVTESIDVILREETEKAVRRAAEQVLPPMLREHLQASLDQMLPKEVQRRVQKEAENLVPDASQKVVSIIEAAAQKLVPRMAKDLIADMTESTLAEVLDKQLPRQVSTLVASELDAQVRIRLGPLIRESADRIKQRLMTVAAAMLVVLLLGVGILVVERYMFFSKYRKTQAEATPPAPAAVTNNETPRPPVAGLGWLLGGTRESRPNQAR
ncbi:MAG: response regulator [Candidatus Sumerlaeaceae bacterium]|nr:response regulator [Candidatus Sumerlaeaceae bacterium]